MAGKSQDKDTLEECNRMKLPFEWPFTPTLQGSLVNHRNQSGFPQGLCVGAQEEDVHLSLFLPFPLLFAMQYLGPDAMILVFFKYLVLSCILS